MFSSVDLTALFEGFSESFSAFACRASFIIAYLLFSASALLFLEAASSFSFKAL